MTVYFLDSSALVKRYVTEQGSPWIQSITKPSAGHHILIACITPVEMVSALARKQRELQIAPRSLKAAMLLIERHTARDYGVVQFTDPVERLAKDLLTRHPLRAYDAIQLASALVSHRHLVAAGLTGLVFISGDVRLLNVANVEAVVTDDPNNHLNGS